MPNDRLHHLLERYFDQMLSGDEKSELEQILMESEEAREFFWQTAHWHGAIRQWGEQEWGRRKAIEAVQARPVPRIVAAGPGRVVPAEESYKLPSSRTDTWFKLALAASIAAAFVVWFMSYPAKPAENRGFAQLIHTSTAVWADQGGAHREGETLNGDTLNLKSGALEIKFAQGATVVLQGPAQFQLTSANSGVLVSGKITATVPPSAHGFRVQTSHFTVTDYGTQFGCIVPTTGQPEVHVFQGVVGVGVANAAEQKLSQNQAVRCLDTGTEPIEADPGKFLTEEQLEQLENAATQVVQWRKASAAFNQYPGMLVHYDFEPDGKDNTKLVNRAPNASPESDGTIVGCQPGEGRWPGKGALSFKGGNDRVEAALPGEFSTLTLVAYVSVDDTAYRENNLIRADPQNDNGSLYWDISSEGKLQWSARVAPRGNAKQWAHAFSPPIFTGPALHSWNMIASVFDGQSVAHYFNGELQDTVPTQLATPVHLGHFEVGNIEGPAPFDPASTISEHFSGRIDEVAILSVPLNASEIHSLYESMGSVPNR